jgi:hypothetical protein
VFQEVIYSTHKLGDKFTFLGTQTILLVFFNFY